MQIDALDGRAPMHLLDASDLLFVVYRYTSDPASLVMRPFEEAFTLCCDVR